jgi:uncharacterized membrane protein
MEGLLLTLGICLFTVLVVLPIWLIVKVKGHDSDLQVLQDRNRYLEDELRKLNVTLSDMSDVVLARMRASAPAPMPAESPPPSAPAPSPLPAPARAEPVRPPLVPQAAAAAIPLAAPAASFGVSGPPPLPAAFRESPSAPERSRPARPAINWEQFMGAKLFAWLGGFALFLGVAFFVKYSFEHNLIPPQVRVALGFLLGIGLVIGGLRISPEKYRITAQTLVATGVVSLYAVTFACDSIYHFALFGPVATFLLMALVTAAAFLLAVRLDAQVVAVLGILGGFLTPVLINTGQDNPAGLFGYVAVLVVGLCAVALHRGWHYLVPLGAAGTILMLLGWADKFYVPEKTGIVVAVCLLFSGICFATYLGARRLGREAAPVLWSAVGLPAVSLGIAWLLMENPVVGARPALLFGLILGADAFLLALAWLDERLPRLHLAAGLAVFALLARWTSLDLSDALLPWALAGSLVFAALHTAFPLVLERRRPGSSPSWWNQLFPPLALLVMLIPVCRFGAVSMLVWPAMLLVDAIAIGVAVLSASLAAVAAVLVLTLLATAVSIFRVPAELAFEPSLLFVIGGFAVFFFFAGLWLVRRVGDRLPLGGGAAAGVFGSPRTQVPALASVLPFLLLIMVCGRLPVPDPSAVFGLGLLLVVLTLGLARLLEAAWLPACALGGMAALELVWHGRHFSAGAPGLPLAWYAGFYLLFAAYPFFFRRAFARMTGPWAVAALSGPAHFWMIYQAIKSGWPNGALGLVPAAFALAPLGSLAAVLKLEEPGNPRRLGPLAWFGGVALLFITLIFPIQFDRQWLTVAWALEGAALLWLFHRIAHPGLRATGAVLLVIAFARLALNPAVLGYHVRGETPLLNWYLYAYGAVIASLFAAGRLLAPPRERVLGVDARALVFALGVVLAFILLNIEIADYFTPPGARALAFYFSGNFARDMTYTIGWALFALGLLAAGIGWGQKSVRYAAIGLLSVALLKLFFHDLARLEALYRIGALFAVAVIAILASFAYQRFLPNHEKASPPGP